MSLNGFSPFLIGRIQIVGNLIFIILIDVIIISIFIQVKRGSEIDLEINFLIAIALFGLVFLYFLGGGGVLGSTS